MRETNAKMTGVPYRYPPWQPCPLPPSLSPSFSVPPFGPLYFVNFLHPWYCELCSTAFHDATSCTTQKSVQGTDSGMGLRYWERVLHLRFFFVFFLFFFFSFADKTLADPWITCGSRCKGPPSIIPFAACTLWLCLWNNYTVQSDTQSTHPVWLSPEITLTFLAEFCYDVHADSISDRKLSPH